MSRLGGDPVERDTGGRGRGGVASPHRVGGDPGAVETDSSARARSIRAGTCPVSGCRLTLLPQIGVNTVPRAVPRTPGVEGRDGIGAGVLSVGDADDLAMAFGIGLGSSDVEHEASRLVLVVGQGEGDELGAARAEA